MHTYSDTQVWSSIRQKAAEKYLTELYNYLILKSLVKLNPNEMIQMPSLLSLFFFYFFFLVLIISILLNYLQQLKKKFKATIT